MSNHEIETIAKLINSPDAQDAALGYTSIVSDDDFNLVQKLYAAEDSELPDNFSSFGDVCDFVRKKQLENRFMKKSWHDLADTLYRPAALAVLSRIRRLNKNNAQMKTCPNPKCKTTGIPNNAQFCPVCGCELKKKSKPQLVDAELTATKTTIRKFRASTISWAAKGAKTVKLDGELLPCPGTKQVFPRGTKKYVVEFLDEKEEVIGSKSLTIEVTPNWYIVIIFIAILSLVGIIAAFSA